MELKIDFGRDRALFDTRRGEFLGNLREYRFSLDTTQPTILTVIPGPVSELKLLCAQVAKAGDVLEVKLELSPQQPGNWHTFRMQLLDPQGKELRMLTGNLPAPSGRAIWELPLAVNQSPGKYVLLAQDIATGVKAKHILVVQ